MKRQRLVANAALLLLISQPLTAISAPQAELVMLPAVQGIQEYILQLPDESFIQPAGARKTALMHKLNTVHRKIVSGEIAGAIKQLQNDIVTKMNGCSWGNTTNDWIIDCTAQADLHALIAALIGYLEKPVFLECPDNEQLLPIIAAVFGDSIGAFSLRKIDPATFAERVAQHEPIDFPLTGPQGAVATTIMTAALEPQRSSGTVVGYLKPPAQELIGEPLGAESSWRLGCSPELDTCGMVSFLDEKHSEPEGLVFNFITGVAFFESVDRLLFSAIGQQFETGCTIFYNVEDVRIPIDFDLDGMTLENFLDESNPLSPQSTESDMLIHIIAIVMDSDGEFYRLDPSSIWRRQASLIANVNLIYHLIEPLSSGTYDIRFEIIGQESWLPGFGPSTRDADALIDELNHPDYFMITHPDRNELSYFLVGYDMNEGVLGVAGGMCGVDATDLRTRLSWDRTFGSRLEHQWNHAWGQQVADEDFHGGLTLYSRVVVAAHEMGHMLGGLHSHGALHACAAESGGWSRICGPTLMLGGAGPLPDFRQPFFSNATDSAFVRCLRRVVGP